MINKNCLEITNYDVDNISTEIYNKTNEIINFDTSSVYTLNIMKYIDIGLQMFNMDRKANEDEIIVSSKKQTVVLVPQHNDFDVETLANNISMEVDYDEISEVPSS
ncbi:13143_t:CDS:2 [Cetraspora pellucida]|uniref:13143_t:CDS:1 n=1 Tax=Cetraspora pellucida TaxID=1433469 RepID=A0A9N9F3K5_9GLOM|nr:13143_t:CDS:2 [Cetraspora pellucida]